MPLARADLESLLRARRLDRTLTSTLPPVDVATTDEMVVAATGIPSLDARLGGGLPRGQLSEIAGPRSSGRTSLLLQTLAAATARGELVALVDALDMLDVESAEAAGIDLARLLWIRGHVVSNPGLCRDLNQRALEQSIRAFSLVLQAGNFGVVAFDVAEAPSNAIRRLPFTTWLRLQRQVEGSQTTAVLVGTEPMARSSAGVTVKLERAEGSARAEGLGLRAGPRLFDGLNIEARVVASRWRPPCNSQFSSLEAQDSFGMRNAEWDAAAPTIGMNAARPVKVTREGDGRPEQRRGSSASGAGQESGCNSEFGMRNSEWSDAAAPTTRSVNAARPLKVMREGDGPSASGAGVGPRAYENVRVPLSTTCA